MKNTVRFIGILFVVLMFFAGCCPQYVFVPSDILFGNTSSEEDEAKEISYGWISTGSGTAESPYVLSTVGDIRGFAELFNSGAVESNASISLTPGEYDFSGIDFPGIGRGTDAVSKEEGLTDASPFTGIFNGNGAVIKNLEIDDMAIAENAGVGFFGAIENSDISNLTFENASIRTSSKAAAIAVGVALNSSISGITVVDSYIESPQTTAGVVSRYVIAVDDPKGEYSIKNNKVEGTTIISTDSYNAAGIIGSFNSRNNRGSSTADSMSTVDVSGNVVDLTGDAYIKGVNVVSGMFGTVFLQSLTDNFSDNKLICDGASDIILTTVAEDEVGNGQHYNISAYIFGNIRKDNGKSVPAKDNTVVIDGVTYTLTFDANNTDSTKIENYIEIEGTDFGNPTTDEPYPADNVFNK